MVSPGLGPPAFYRNSAIIPAIEGLIYPYVMGLSEDVALDGPNADLIKHLKTHMATILVPGVCIDANTKGWNLSSSSSTTWLSKVYLNQFITEHILGMKSAATGHDADAAHYAYEVLGAPAVGFPRSKWGSWLRRHARRWAAGCDS